jgi:hypothetical protein
MTQLLVSESFVCLTCLDQILLFKVKDILNRLKINFNYYFKIIFKERSQVLKSKFIS